MFESFRRLKAASSVSMNRRIIILTVLVVMALSTRLLSLSVSQYPFNNDSLNECRIADDILESNHLIYPEGSHYVNSQSVVTPAYNILLAFSSASLGLSAFNIAQVVTAILSVVALVGIYITSMQITGSTKAAMCAYLVLALFGTFVYLTGSSWKEGAGISMLILLVFAYMNRSQPQMFALEIVLLSVLPLVHHLVTVIAYIALACMTAWSISFVVLNGSLRRRHFIDASVLGVISVGALSYYFVNSLDGFRYFETEANVLLMGLSFTLVTVVGMTIFSRRRHVSFSLAWISASVILGFFVWNHIHPLFPYVQGEPDSVLILGVATSLLIGIAWFGWETLAEGTSRYRMIPFGVLLSVITILLFALLSGSGLDAHKVFYRTIDIAVISLALGASVAVAGLIQKPRRQLAVIVCLLVALLVTFPFGVYTGTLVGVRHDTQGYEVDALEWVYVSSGRDTILQSDERLAYSSRVLYDFEKNAGLPSVLSEERLPRANAINLMLEEWTSVGVSDYPYGYRILDETFISYCIESSNVYYVGGPASNNLWLFEVSEYALASSS